jgi:hypothetical protein
VEHEAGAVKVVVSGPLFRRPLSKILVAVGMVSTVDDEDDLNVE